MVNVISIFFIVFGIIIMIRTFLFICPQSQKIRVFYLSLAWGVLLLTSIILCLFPCAHSIFIFILPVIVILLYGANKLFLIFLNEIYYFPVIQSSFKRFYRGFLLLGFFLMVLFINNHLSY